MGEMAVEGEDSGADEGTLEDTDVSRELPSEAEMAAATTSRPATRIVGIRRVVLRPGSRELIRPVKGPRCRQHVSGIRYASDMWQGGSIGACVC